MVNPDEPESLMAKKILLIERSDGTAKKIDDFLSEMGYKISVCSQDDLALECVRDILPNLIIINEKQTLSSGHDLVEQIKKEKRFAKIPIVMMSSKKPNGDRIMADSYIKLPPEPTKLYNAVSHWLESGIEVEVQSGGDNKGRNGSTSKNSASASNQSSRRTVINPVSLGKIFHYLLSKSGTGQLRFISNRKRMKISVQDGVIVDVKTNYIQTGSLGRFLIREGKITSAENDSTRRRAEDLGKKQGELLVQLSILTRAELEVAIRKQKSQKLLSLFTEHWEDGEYDFRENLIEETDDIPLSLPIAEFLVMAVFNHLSHKKAYNSLLRNKKISVEIYPSADFDDVAERLGLRKNHLKLMELIEGKTLRDLKLDEGERFKDIVLLTFLLATSQGISFGTKPVRKPKKKPEVKRKIKKTPKAAPPPPETPDIKPASPPLQTSTEEHPPAPEFLTGDAPTFSDEFFETYEKGRELFDEADYAQAKPILEAALELNPRSSDVLAMLAWIKYTDGGVGVRDEARDMLKKSLLIDDLNDIAHLMIGQIYKEENRIPQAAHHYKTAFRLNPMNEDAKAEFDKLEIKLRSQKDRGL
jgi:DNA-binding response OmpR family regulator/tetratricopeptide (TPR) repeat protein